MFLLMITREKLFIEQSRPSLAVQQQFTVIMVHMPSIKPMYTDRHASNIFHLFTYTGNIQRITVY